MNKLTINDIDVKDKRILIRVDFNVPLDKDLNITDDKRIRASLPTIKYCLDNGAKKIILASHLGRPKGQITDAYRLTPVALKLAILLEEPVKKLDDCVGDVVKKDIRESGGRIVLLENLRFHPEEEENGLEFAKELASLADLYINDAFGTAHRAHASTEGVTHFLKSAAGLLLIKEIEYLGGALDDPKKPFVLILGGAKVTDKILLIENMLSKVDHIIIGGGMCYTFLKAQGKNIGNSKLEADKIDVAKMILNKAVEVGVEISLPVDNIVTDKIDGSGKIETVGDSIPDGLIGVDVGEKTIENFSGTIKNAATIVWNGPLGIFEVEEFSKGSFAVAKLLSEISATKIIGGGDTAAMIAKFNLEDKMTHISTGGGASLEYMEGKVLPGISALSDKE